MKSYQREGGKDVVTQSRITTNMRVINNDEIIRGCRRRDRLLSFLNEDEVLLLSNSEVSATVQVSDTHWSKEKLIDMIHQDLMIVNIKIERNGETLLIPKYSEQVIDLAPKLSVYRPTPELTINLSDLDEEIILRLHKLDNKERHDILQRAGKKLFKTFFPHYYNMVADLVKIRIRNDSETGRRG